VDVLFVMRNWEVKFRFPSKQNQDKYIGIISLRLRERMDIFHEELMTEDDHEFLINNRLFLRPLSKKSTGSSL
jgi:hypothetical protein